MRDTITSRGKRERDLARLLNGAAHGSSELRAIQAELRIRAARKPQANKFFPFGKQTVLRISGIRATYITKPQQPNAPRGLTSRHYDNEN
jgi:hypothetical protein